MIPYTWGTQSGQIHGDRKTNGGYQRMGGGGNGELLLMGTEFQFYKMKRVLEKDGGGWAPEWTYSMLSNCTLNIVKMVNIMLHVFYHSVKKSCFLFF